jgi:hypothetical protein
LKGELFLASGALKPSGGASGCFGDAPGRLPRPWTKSSQQSRLARFSHSTMQRERDDATLPKIWTPRNDCDRTF